MSKTLTIAPFNRVEGDLKIKVEIKNGVLADAMVSGVMFRGFEKILKGRYPEDALVFTPRICGMCSISHSVASSNALKSVSEEFSPSENGRVARNICHAVENVASHISQFYLYCAPDFLNEKYKKLAVYSHLWDRLLPAKGSSFIKVLNERKRFFEILGLIAGKWPHTLALQPGGITKSLSSSDILRVRGVLEQFSSVAESVLLGMSMNDYLSIKSVAEFESSFSQNESDLGLFFAFAGETGLTRMGKGEGRFISGGGYPLAENEFYFPSGSWDGVFSALDTEEITESVRYSFFESPNSSSRPAADISEPKWDKTGAYSWCKAPRYKEKVVEVGAIARQVISGDSLMTELFLKYGSTVFTRIFARLHETVKLLNEMRSWMEQLEPNGNYYAKNVLRETASGYGITEAARGFLGHWISVDNGRIKNYQVITPTAWNASPRDEKGVPGAMEQALINTPIEDEQNPIEIEHIIRSYDPCLVCSVH
jgi:hydrogenase large subunit